MFMNGFLVFQEFLKQIIFCVRKKKKKSEADRPTVMFEDIEYRSK